MGVYFAMRSRNWYQLLLERSRRILIPFIFGILIIVPIQISLLLQHYSWPLRYSPSPAHLWFLGNIFIYVVVLTPLFYWIKKHEVHPFVFWMKKILSHPLGLSVVLVTFILEALLVVPTIYELYAMTWHGFALGLLAFFFGFCFVLCGESFRKMLLKWRWVFLTISIAFYVYRLNQPQMNVPHFLVAIESNFWIFTVLAFGFRYLNHSSRALTFLSQAAYPIYILHMIFLSIGSIVAFQLDIPSYLQFLIILTVTIIGCFACYEFLIRRCNILRLLFGLKKYDWLSHYFQSTKKP